MEHKSKKKELHNFIFTYFPNYIACVSHWYETFECRVFFWNEYLNVGFAYYKQ